MKILYMAYDMFWKLILDVIKWCGPWLRCDGKCENYREEKNWNYNDLNNGL